MVGESACNPSSVEGDHLSRLPVAWHLQRPTRGRGGPPHPPSCSVLLRVGFAVPTSRLAAGELLPHRFTLTARAASAAVYFLWHFPSGRPHWALPSTLPYGARTFLRCGLSALHPRSPSRSTHSQGKEGAVFRAPGSLSHTWHTGATASFQRRWRSLPHCSHWTRPSSARSRFRMPWGRVRWQAPHRPRTTAATGLGICRRIRS